MQGRTKLKQVKVKPSQLKHLSNLVDLGPSRVDSSQTRPNLSQVVPTLVDSSFPKPILGWVGLGLDLA